MVAGERQRARTHWWGVSVIGVRDVVGCGWSGRVSSLVAGTCVGVGWMLDGRVRVGSVWGR